MKFERICLIILITISTAICDSTKHVNEDSAEDDITQGEKVIMIVYYFLTLVLIISCFLFINSKI